MRLKKHNAPFCFNPALILLLCLTSTLPAETKAPFDASWSQNALWDDGNAEVAIYQASRVRYGKKRSYETTLIIVKEDFDKKQIVKSDTPGKNSFVVLKLNISSLMPTDKYDYHWMTSVYVRRENPTRLVKFTHSSQEWCGNTFKEIRLDEKPVRLHHHSYFDGEADGAYPLDYKPGDFLEEQLFLSLRALVFKDKTQFKARVLSPQISNRAPKPTWRKLTFYTSGPSQISVPAGEFNCWKVEAKTGAGNTTLTYWFNKDHPHTLVQFETSNERQLKLKKLRRYQYW